MATPIPLNRCSFTAAEIAAATGAIAPAGGRGLRAGSVTIDSRSAEPGALFVALRGTRDGHEFLEAAARAGAAAAVVERGRALPTLPCFEVDDTLAALGALAEAHLARTRQVHSLPTIAIGGAAGKTTTKELTAAVMRALYGTILATPGNLNNLIGVPMTVFQLDETHRAAVVECGTNQRGEIARLAAIVRPDATLVLNADIEHTEGLGSLEGVADEEAALFRTARCAVVSTEEPMLLKRVPSAMRRLTFGSAPGADVRLIARELTGAGEQRLRIELGADRVETGVAAKLTVVLELLGASAASNATAAIAAACAALERPLRSAEIEAVAAALKYVEPVDGRMRLRDCAGVTVIDDTYNSNPRSLVAALATAREVADARRTRLILALGDMLELGGLSPEMHDQALNDMFAVEPDSVLVVGPEMIAAARRKGLVTRAVRGSLMRIAADSAEAARLITTLVRPGDLLLVKGSRGIAMEQVIAALDTRL